MTNDKFIVIGGGPSGSTVASLLAMKGHKVLLFEKEKFPRPHVGESLLPFNYHLFKELGVLDTMEKKYHRKPGVKFTNSDGSTNTVWYFDHAIKDPSSLSFHVDRAHFDNMLLDRTKELGVEVIEETTVKHVEFNHNDDIVKVSTRNKDGVEEDFFTKFIIDASGQSTFLANTFNDKKNYDGLERVAINSHWQNPTYDKELGEGCIEIIHLGGEKMGWIWAIPLSKTRLSVGVVMSNSYFLSQRKRFAGEKKVLDKIYLSELNESKLVDKILSKAKKEAPAMAHGDYSYYTDTKYGKNYAVIGDASAF
uniref:NAD(P)/FAD-dependent oxidoreductase n=1 Tax=uncultured Planktosalinus sp. TaxID=1810935 RepID=UPI0030D72A0D